MNPALVPSLDELAADPGRAATLAPDVARALTLRCAAVLAALAVPAATPNLDGRPSSDSVTGDRLLRPSEAAAILGVTPRWLYRHARRLPFTRRLSRKALRFSEHGLRRWHTSQRG